VQEISLPYNQEGNRWVVVLTDAHNQHYEITDATPPSHPNAESNNTVIDDQVMRLRFPRLPNLQVTSLTPPSDPFSSQTAVVSWQVTNTGDGPTSAPSWYDEVHLSLNEVYGDGTTSTSAMCRTRATSPPGPATKAAWGSRCPQGFG